VACGCSAVATSVAGLYFARAKSFQVFAQRVVDESGAVYARLFGSASGGAKQFQIQRDLDGFHTVVELGVKPAL